MPTNSPYRQWVYWPASSNARGVSASGSTSADILRHTSRNAWGTSDSWSTTMNALLGYGFTPGNFTRERSLASRLCALAQHYGLGDSEELHVRSRGSYWVLDNFVDRVFLPVRYGDEGFYSTRNSMTAVDMTERVTKRGKL